MFDETTIETLKAKYGTIYLLAAAGFEVVVRPPTRQVWRKFRSLAADPAKRADCVEGLFRDCVVYPELKDVDAMLNQKPALAETFGDECATLGGAKEDCEKNAL